MKNLSRQLFILIITLAIAGLALAQNSDDATTLAAISGYRQWTKVNAEPVKGSRTFEGRSGLRRTLSLGRP